MPGTLRMGSGRGGGNPRIGGRVGSILCEGDYVDRYRIVREIGRGGFATVYLAEHRGVRAPRALKVLHEQHASDPELVRRFSTEATTLAQMDNAHVVKVHDAGVAQDGQLFIAMEFLEGHTLRDELNENSLLSPHRACSIIRQAATGVAAAHRGDFIHRDLKPENLFLCTDGAVKVLDFGIVKFVRTRHKTTAAKAGVFGTVGYMAPEQLDGQPVDDRTDVYALGVVLHECLMGVHPFADEDGRVPNHREMARRVLHGAPLPLRYVPPLVAAVVVRAMSRDPDYRFADMEEFERAVADSTAAVSVIPSPPKRKTLTIPLAPILVGILLGTVVATLMYLTLSPKSHNPTETMEVSQ